MLPGRLSHGPPTYRRTGAPAHLDSPHPVRLRARRMFSKYVTVDGVALNYFHTGASTLARRRRRRSIAASCCSSCTAPARTRTPGIASWRTSRRRHSALALDFPGHGRSGSTEGLPDLDAHVRCLARFVADARACGRAVLVGRAHGRRRGDRLRARPSAARARAGAGGDAGALRDPAGQPRHLARRDMGRATQPFSPCTCSRPRSTWR